MASSMELIERWKEVEDAEEEEEEVFRTMKTKWFHDACSFLSGLPEKSHIWCEHEEVAKPLLEPFHNYMVSAPNNPIVELWKRMSGEFRVCIRCVVKYHKCKEYYCSEFTPNAVAKIMSVLETLDKSRISTHLKELLATKEERSHEVVCVLFELLSYPELLELPPVNEAFVPFLVHVSKIHELTFTNKQRFPGIYALLFHSNAEIRSIALGLAQSIGELREVEELDAVQPIIDKRITSLERAMTNSDVGHLGTGVTVESIWLGLKTFLGFVRGSAFEDGIVERYPSLVSIVLNNVSESSNIFWNALLCLKLLLEVLGYKLWEKSSFSPGVVRNTLLSQCFHSKEDRIHKAIFDVFQPFLKSLEALKDDHYENQRRNMLYFFLIQVPNSSNFSSLIRKTASQVAFAIVSRGYKMQPPCVAFECSHFWGPPLLSTYKDTQLHPSVRQPAIDLVEVILVADAAVLASRYSKSQTELDEETAEGWQTFAKMVATFSDKWYCLPLVWIEVLDAAASSSSLSETLSKAFVWAASRLFLFDSKINELPKEVAAALTWERPKGVDDGADGKMCANAVSADVHLLELIPVFKGYAESFARSQRSELFATWSWDPSCAEPVLLLLLDPSENVRYVGRQILYQLAPNGNLETRIEAIFQDEQAALSFSRGFAYATKMLLIDPFKHSFSLHQLFFIASKVFSVCRRLGNDDGPWKQYCQNLSCTLWPLILKSIHEGKPDSANEVWCLRMLELLPMIFKCTFPATVWECGTEDSPGWFSELVGWGRTDSRVILRRWNDAMTSILEDLARGPFCHTVKQSKAVVAVLQPGSGMETDDRERMEVLFSSTSADGVQVPYAGPSSYKPPTITIEEEEDDDDIPLTSLTAPLLNVDDSDDDIPLATRRANWKKETDAAVGPMFGTQRKAAAASPATQTTPKPKPTHKRPSMRKPTLDRFFTPTKTAVEPPKPSFPTVKPPAAAPVPAPIRAPTSIPTQAPVKVPTTVPTAAKARQTEVSDELASLFDLINEGQNESEAAIRQRIAPSVAGPRRKLVQIGLPGEPANAVQHARRARLHRPTPPRLDDWLTRILAFNLTSLDAGQPCTKEEQLQQVPMEFKDAEHYMDVFRPLMLAEFQAQVQRSRQEVNLNERANVGVLNLVTLDRVDDLYTGRFQGTDEAAKACSENDLILLSKLPYAEAKKSVHAFGKVDRKDTSRTEGTFLYVKLNLSSVECRKAANAFLGRTAWHVTRLMSMTPQIREFQAVSALAESPFLDVVTNPSASRNALQRPTLESANLSKELCARLRGDYNESQLSAIEACLGKHSVDSHHMSLVQGPPGTGKTRTIVAIISAILQSARAQQDDGKDRSSSRRDSMRNVWQDLALAKQLDGRGPTGRGRVLVCAQSNAAVDELVSRICENGLYNGAGGFYKPNVVRVGNEKSVHTSSNACFINTLVTKRLDEEMQPDRGDVVAEAALLRKNLTETWEQIYQVEPRLAQLRDQCGDESEVSRLTAKLNLLHLKRKQINPKLQEAEKLAKSKLEGDKNRRRQVRHEIIREAEVVLTTLSASGGEIYSVCMDSIGHNNSPGVFFDAVVIDEAAQALEPATLIPMQLVSFVAGNCVMIGDPKQLPATVISQSVAKLDFQRSMFERLQTSGYPVTMLSVQYRMHPEIRKFPSLHFYNDKLMDGESVLNDRRVAPFHKESMFVPYKFFDVVDGQECGKDGELSISNFGEVSFVVELFKIFVARYSKDVKAGRIGIITPYKRQQTALRESIGKEVPDLVSSIEFNTIDGFQGREVDILILSTVRTEKLGFVADVRRMNVALTRARFSLWIVGNSKLLKRDPAWAALLQDASERQLVTRIQRPYQQCLSRCIQQPPEQSVLNQEAGLSRERGETRKDGGTCGQMGDARKDGGECSERGETRNESRGVKRKLEENVAGRSKMARALDGGETKNLERGVEMNSRQAREEEQKRRRSMEASQIERSRIRSPEKRECGRTEMNQRDRRRPQDERGRTDERRRPEEQARTEINDRERRWPEERNEQARTEMNDRERRRPEEKDEEARPHKRVRFDDSVEGDDRRRVADDRRNNARPRVAPLPHCSRPPERRQIQRWDGPVPTPVAPPDRRSPVVHGPRPAGRRESRPRPTPAGREPEVRREVAELEAQRLRRRNERRAEVKDMDGLFLQSKKPERRDKQPPPRK